tara:strand:+ start:121 stop:423 length:303 start_codon:yes stop_codon:yes gene_type:complete
VVTSNPTAYNLVTQSAYDEMMNELTSASNADTPPYSEGWFYLPNQGWLWTTRTTYPYFFDNTSKAWMYFQSGKKLREIGMRAIESATEITFWLRDFTATA